MGLRELILSQSGLILDLREPIFGFERGEGARMGLEMPQGGCTGSCTDGQMNG